MASSFVKSLESAFLGVADQTLNSATPTGGFAAFLTGNPAAAALYVILFQSAHDYLSMLEAKVAAPAPAVAVVPPTVAHP